MVGEDRTDEMATLLFFRVFMAIPTIALQRSLRHGTVFMSIEWRSIYKMVEKGGGGVVVEFAWIIEFDPMDLF